MPQLSIINKTSLGIDISNGRINLALLKQAKDGVKLLKTAGTAVPEGAIIDGNVKDPPALADAIKQLLTSNKIRAGRVVVSLVARPVLTQIMDLPKQIAGNMSQYVQNELKQCAILPNKNTAVDYCGISSPGKAANARVFVVATENEKITQMTQALNQAGLNLKAVEPNICACIRALYAKKIAKKFDSNVLIAAVTDGIASLCVFRNQCFDFIRSKQMGGDVCRSGEARDVLAQEINAILQFYDIEVPDSPDKRELIVLLNRSGSQAEEVGQFLKNRFANVDVQVSTPQDICRDTPAVADCDTSEISLAAVGLAMKPLDLEGPNLKINLLPAETAQLSAARKHALITANIAAGVLITMIIAAGFLSSRLKRANEAIELLQQKQASEATLSLLAEREAITRQVDSLSAKLDEINRIVPPGQTTDWSKVLNEIRLRTPRALRITALFSDDKSRVRIEGQSVSYEAVHLFVDMLTESNLINTADLIGTEKDDGSGGLVSYSIACSLTAGEGARSNVN